MIKVKIQEARHVREERERERERECTIYEKNQTQKLLNKNVDIRTILQSSGAVSVTNEYDR